ncbi:hypothetical protein AYO20_11461 [Fonsecaea nubica]|uniref:Xylanolytic transcriptional activator regulatory domain-containing protein n=1 Tax=Fonsecaea nubica TaxID=856822 RepID=A0A178BUU4_9EURO|nr:hypothetical protein AYO20_11461 [Fonsecaea nubica]OAL20934.1 hypothetical protein AYO20_11461 [Fonsecaea nubica]
MRIRRLEEELSRARYAGHGGATLDAMPHSLSDHGTSLGLVARSPADMVDRPSTQAPALASSRSQIVNTSSPIHQPSAATELIGEAEATLEGPTSLIGHSRMAIGFLDMVAGVDRRKGFDFDTGELLNTLNQIVQALRMQDESPPGDRPATAGLPSHRNAEGMPPIAASVAAIRNAQDYIILNAALSYHEDSPSSRTFAEYKSTCLGNLETALSALPLHIPPSTEMTLALILGAVHAVDLLRPFWAWTLVSAAYNIAYVLGCHLGRPRLAEWCDNSNPSGMLFWVIYFLEKTLSLRLGRCSTIADGEITVMLPGGSPGFDYARSMVKLAQLSGKIYEKLYGVQARAAYRAQGTLPVRELSQELDEISQRSQKALQEWRLTGPSNDWRQVIDFLYASDNVLLHSMQTLIHRTVSAPSTVSSSTSLTAECIASAREALACHQSCPAVLAGVQSAFLSSYISWFIMLRPFTPFIVLFCHVLETGNQEDLGRMHRFIASMESVSPGSDAARKHQRLFQVFHDVALRYTQLKTTSALAHGDGGLHVSDEIGSCLTAMGFELPSEVTGGCNSGNDTSLLLGVADAAQPLDVDLSTAELLYWFQVNQQMVETDRMWL